MKKLFSFISLLLFFPLEAFAQPSPQRMFDNSFINSFSKSAGLQNSNGVNIDNDISFFIAFAFGFVGIIILAMTLIAGFKWMTAQGDKEKISSAKKTVLGSTVGLLLLVTSYSVSDFIITAINKTQGNNFTNTQQLGNTGIIGTEPGQLSQTVCEFNSQCPISAPFCSQEGAWTANMGYCNCCDNDVPGYECNKDVETKNKYCQEQFATAAGYNAVCEGIGNFTINSACVIRCDPTKPKCPPGQFCNSNFINNEAFCATLPPQ